MKIYDTRLRKKITLLPQDGKCVRMYTCGPTVYNYVHIGNLRTFIFEDLLRRAIKLSGFDVFQVMNLTDVDDKTIKGALEANLSLDAFTKKYKDAFFEDIDTLFIERAEAYPAATDHIEGMIKLIQILIAKKIAYLATDGNVFFHIDAFPEYGSLSHLKRENLQIGASNRVNQDEYDKESVCDFVLWKAYDQERDGNIAWESPWGMGRPGWHIECSAMAMHYLGESFDLHTGAVDNCFPHHENEIAQSEAATGKPFALHWMHSEHLIVEGRKMAKSLGNFYTLRDLKDRGYTGRSIRMLLISTHYRQKLNFTFDALDGAKNSLDRIDAFRIRLKEIKQQDGVSIKARLMAAQERFKEFIQDDLNISGALSVLFDLIREVNAHCDALKLSKRESEDCIRLLNHFDTILGTLQNESYEIPEELIKALEEREKARALKDFKTADSMRAKIIDGGYIIEDSISGPRLKKV